MNRKKNRNAKLKRRHLRIRRKVAGTQARPRLCVTRSLKNISAQLIDDDSGKTIAAVSTLSPELKGDLENGGNVKAAVVVGTLVAKKATDSNISEVVFDRGGNRYHGRIKALADAAREGGLKF